MAVTLIMVLAELAYDSLHRFLQGLVMVFRRQRKDISPMTKEILADLSIYFQTLRDSHA